MLLGVFVGVTDGVTAIGVVIYSLDGEDAPPLLQVASVYK